MPSKHHWMRGSSATTSPRYFAGQGLLAAESGTSYIERSKRGWSKVSSDRGYIKIYRDLWDHWVWRDKPYSMGQAWIDLIMMANHEDKKLLFDGQMITIKRGSVVTSERKLAERWGWSRSKVHRFLNLFESEKMVCVNRTNKRTTISIVNYNNYQDSRATERTTEKPQTSHRRAADEHKQYTNKDTNKDTKKNIYTRARVRGEAELEEGDFYDEEGWEDP